MCVREKEANWCVSFYLFVKVCVLSVACVYVCAFAHTCGSNGGRMVRQRDSSLRKAGRKERERVREGGAHPPLVVQPCPPASSPSPEASASLEQPFRK